MIFSLHCYPMYIIRKERCPGTRGLRSRDLETVKVLGPKVLGINKSTNWKRPRKLEILVKVTQINYVSRHQLHSTANLNFGLMGKISDLLIC